MIDKARNDRGAVSDVTDAGLVGDCEVLLAARDTLAGRATLNWSADTPITEWDGVIIKGTPERICGLHLFGEGLTGTIPALQTDI